jgi:phosphatidylserine decarboxylase
MNFLHRILDYCLSSVKLIKNQEVGWRTVNRKTGKQGREQQPILKKIKLLFLFSRFVEWVDVTQAMRLWIHDKTIQEGTYWGV